MITADYTGPTSALAFLPTLDTETLYHFIRVSYLLAQVKLEFQRFCTPEQSAVVGL